MRNFLIISLIASLIIWQGAVSQTRVKVLIVYYSVQGHTRAMAEAVANGARSVKGVNVKLLSVKEAQISDVLSAVAIIIGSPVYNANVAPPMQEFINK
ncbi:MAG: flavodoxin domain-containing protein [Deltaproteobacteria bacterium]|nr:flavodoxin domain-containing protein [Deltaproteobacteria bacterium]